MAVIYEKNNLDYNHNRKHIERNRNSVFLFEKKTRNQAEHVRTFKRFTMIAVECDGIMKRAVNAHNSRPNDTEISTLYLRM